MTDPDLPAVSGVRRSRGTVVAAQSVAVVGLAGAMGCLAGWVWWELWSPAPTGIAFEGEWYPRPATEGLMSDFDGTGWYVVVAVAAGLLLGLASGLLLDHDELVTLVAVVVGSILAAWLMREVGESFSAPDPEGTVRLAQSVYDLVGVRVIAERSELPGDLELAGRSPLLAFPVGAMTGLVIALLGVTKHRRATY